MNLIADKSTERLVHKLVPCQRSLAIEFAGDNQRLEMRIVVARDLDDRVVETGLD